MQITDYTTLQTAIAQYLNREDLTAQIPMFIQFVESELNVRLRTRQMVVRAQAVSANEYVQLPADWLEAINLQIVGGTSPLRFVTLDEADCIIRDQLYTQTVAYSLMNGAIELVPPPGDDVEIEMVYYGKIPALSDEAPTNWLLLRDPAVYLYGACMHAAPFLIDDQRIPTFGSFYAARVEALNDESMKALHSGGPLIARTRRHY